MFCLRLLLIDVKGATSFEYLRTVDGTEHPTFKLACIARNLMENNHVRENAIEGAAAFQMPIQLRQLFVDICSHCNVTDPLSLFQRNLFHFIEDYIRNGHDEEVGKNLALRWIQQKLQLNGFVMETNFGLPAPNLALFSELF